MSQHHYNSVHYDEWLLGALAYFVLVALVESGTQTPHTPCVHGVN